MPFTGILGTIFSQPGNFELAAVPAQDLPWLTVAAPAAILPRAATRSADQSFLFTAAAPPVIENLPWLTKPQPRLLARAIAPAQPGWSPSFSVEDLSWYKRHEDKTRPIQRSVNVPTWRPEFSVEDLSWSVRKEIAKERPTQKAQPVAVWIPQFDVENLPWLIRNELIHPKGKGKNPEQFNPGIFVTPAVDQLPWLVTKTQNFFFAGPVRPIVIDVALFTTVAPVEFPIPCPYFPHHPDTGEPDNRIHVETAPAVLLSRTDALVETSPSNPEIVRNFRMTVDTGPSIFLAKPEVSGPVMLTRGDETIGTLSSHPEVASKPDLSTVDLGQTPANEKPETPPNPLPTKTEPQQKYRPRPEKC